MRVCVRHSRPRAGVFGVYLDRLREHLPRMLETLATQLVKALTSAQIVIVRLHVHGARLFDLLLLALAEYDAERFNDRLRDVVLNREHILHLAIVSLRPELIAVGDIHQLRSDAQSIAHAANTAVENRRDAKLPPDFREILILSLERERHSA